mgnify:CR=1 FL=1
MSYRAPNSARIAAQQLGTHFQHAGHTATWKQYISASAGIAAAGMGSAPRYREQTITALFGSGHAHAPEQPTPAGLFAAAEIYAVTRERVGRSDELVWRGIPYRVESDPAPGRLAGTWISTLKRSKA